MEKVSDEKIKKLEDQKPIDETTGTRVLDGIDAGDRSFGRIFSKIGRYIVENF